jgi:hypothetical protein
MEERNRRMVVSRFEKIQSLQVALAAWEIVEDDLDSKYVNGLINKYKEDIQSLKKDLKFDFKETIRKRKKSVNDDWKF